MLSEQELNEIRKREQAATGGPLEAQEPAMAPGIGWGRVKGPKATREYYGSMCFDRIEDVEFIAHARTDIPALLADVEFWKLEWAKAQKEPHYLNEKHYFSIPFNKSEAFDDCEHEVCVKAREILKEK